MSTLHVDHDISMEDLQQLLAEQLGSGYKFTVTSPTTLKVRQNSLMIAAIRKTPEGSGVTLHVSSFGLIVGRAVNALTITRKVRHALQAALPQNA